MQRINRLHLILLLLVMVLIQACNLERVEDPGRGEPCPKKGESGKLLYVIPPGETNADRYCMSDSCSDNAFSNGACPFDSPVCQQDIIGQYYCSEAPEDWEYACEDFSDCPSFRPFCIDNKCVPRSETCDGKRNYCDGDKVVSCTDGKWVAYDCIPNTHCDDGYCTDSDGEVCMGEYGESLCDGGRGGRRFKCVSDNWLLIPCQNGTVCDYGDCVGKDEYPHGMPMD